MSPEEMFNQIAKTIPATELDRSLMEKTAGALKSGIQGNKVTDVVFEAISKHVEVRLRTMYENFTGEKLATGGNFGQFLLNALQDSGLIRESNGNPEPIFFLLKWYFGERNAPHHTYDTYDLEQFASYLMISNRIILEFESRKKDLPRAVVMDIVLNPAQVRLGSFFTLETKISRPDDGTSVERGKVEAVTTFNNRSQHKDMLNFSLGQHAWQGNVHTSGAVAGDFSVQIFVVGEGVNFVSKNPAKGKIFLA